MAQLPGPVRCQATPGSGCQSQQTAMNNRLATQT